MSTTAPPSRPPKPRSRWPRYVAIALAILMMPFVVVATTIAATGTVTVRVQDHSPDGMNLIVPVPALLFDVVAFVAPRVIPDEALDEVRRELGPWKGALLETAEALEDCPSGILVEVDSGEEHVTVEKRGNRYRIAVDSPDVDVRVTIPDRLMRRTLQALDLV